MAKRESKTKEKINAQETENNTNYSEVIVNYSNILEKQTQDTNKEIGIRSKLSSLYSLQIIDSAIDKIKIIRGELPIEVQDLEDDIAGLQKRLESYISEIEKYKRDIHEDELFKKDCLALIERYQQQLNNVRNNREYDALNKEIEYQHLEIKHADKRINDIKKLKEAKEEEVNKLKTILEERKKDLELKKIELEEIIKDNEEEEKQLLAKREKILKRIEEKYLISYNKLRRNARNGLAIVNIERSSCGGCFNQIPPQRQIEIKQHQKIIVCEFCGRILVDDSIVQEATKLIEE